MLVNFWSSPALRGEFEASFSYRASSRYTKGLGERVRIDLPVYPMRYPDFSDPGIFPAKWPLLVKLGVSVCLRLILTVPLFCFEIWILRRLFLRLQPDIIHINNGGYPGALSARAAAIAARLGEVRNVVMVVNNLASDYSGPHRWLDYPLDRLVVGSVSMFVTGSAAALVQLKKVLRLDDAKCLSLHNGIALRETTETREQTRKRFALEKFDGVIFGVVAILQRNKGHQVLLDAMVKLLERLSIGEGDVKILIEGDGPLRGDLQKFVTDNKLSGHCIFVGNEKNVMNFVALLDVLILPSIGREDFPNVVLEAMGLGKPVIASRLAGTPEQVIDGETGILVVPRDADHLAAAIARLSADWKLRLSMGGAATRRFQRYFTAEIAVNRYLLLYQSLIEN